MLVFLEQRPAGLHGQLDDPFKLDRLLTGGRPFRGVIRDTSSRSSTIRVMCLICSAMTSIDQAVGPVRPFDAHDLNGVADRSQRVSQLVGEHGEKMILALVVFAKCFLHSLAVVDVGNHRADTQDGAFGRLDGIEAAKPVALATGLSRRSR